MAAKSDSRLAVFAYDGTELAAHAIEEAGRLLDTATEALVVTVWQPFEVGFTPAGGEQFDAAEISDVRRAAEQTAAEGASRAKDAGFDADAVAVEGAPTWKALVELADERGASIIVMGSHGRSGISGVLLGSVASSVASHWGRSVMIVHRKD
ncbi:MAG TPA: universal stress protein [Solirubrobacteraceae bacterium]|jgi:nucleotide-binding universal stress UspA family protein|nr:universal stress protein [Solirubrobacteraceae bacterium]